MPHPARTAGRPALRLASVFATLAALVGALLAAPTASASAPLDDADRPATSDRQARASAALTRAQGALAGDGRNATMALRDLSMLSDSLPLAERAAAARLAGRPGANRRDCSSPVACVQWQTGETKPSWARLVRGTVTTVGKIYRKAGYRSPKPDFGKGGSSKPDIYVDNLPQGLYGYCTIDNNTRQPGPGRFDVPAFCVVDNNYAGFPTNTPKQNLQVTVAHEFFHAVQFAYDFYEDSWFMEATAAWVEDEVYDRVDDNRQYLRQSPISSPTRSMDEFGELFHYGVWIFFRYLTEEFKKKKGKLPRLVLDMWRAADSRHGAAKNLYSAQAIDKTLVRLGLPLDQAFSRFSDANRRSREEYGEGKKNRYPVKNLAGRVALSAVGANQQFSATLDHLTSATFSYIPQGLGGTSRLGLTFDLGTAVEGSRAVVTVYQPSGASSSNLVPLDDQGNGSFNAPFDSASVAAVEVTLVNASIRFTNCFDAGTAYSCSGNPVDENVGGSVLGVVAAS